MTEWTHELTALEAARTLDSLTQARQEWANRVIAPVSFHHKFGFVATLGAVAQLYWVPPVQIAMTVIGLGIWGWALRTYYLKAGRTLLVQRRGATAVVPILLAILVPPVGTVATAQTQSVVVAALSAIAIVFTYVVILPRGDAAWTQALVRDVTQIHASDGSISGDVDALLHGPHRTEICSLLDTVHQAETALLRLVLGLEERVLGPQLDALESGGLVTVKRGPTGRSKRPQVALTKSGRKAYRHHFAALGALTNPGW